MESDSAEGIFRLSHKSLWKSTDQTDSQAGEVVLMTDAVPWPQRLLI